VRVYGEEITQAQIDAINAAMVGNFDHLMICRVAIRNGVNKFNYVGRVVDRLLQKARKAGKIEYTGKAWRKLP
jgi:hypothetical protein